MDDQHRSPFASFFDNVDQPDPFWLADDIHTAAQAATLRPAADDIASFVPPTTAEQLNAPSPFFWSPAPADDFDLGFDPGDPLIHGAGFPDEAFQGLVDGLGAQDIAVDHGTPEAPAPPALPAPRNRGPSAQSWTDNKPEIQRLYIGQNLTLEETRRWMKEKRGFDASKQMYKEKFQEWGFVKRLPRKITGKLLRIADERKPKDTVFSLNGKDWTAGQLRKKHGRGGKRVGHASYASPPDLPIDWRTPTPSISPAPEIALGRQLSNRPVFSVSPPLPVRSDPALLGHGWNPEMPSASGIPNRSRSPLVAASSMPPPRAATPLTSQRLTFAGLSMPSSPLQSSSGRPWSFESLPPPTGIGQDPFPLPPLTTRRTWRGKTLEELRSMRRDALSSLELAGRTHEAARNLRNVVDGFQYLLTPTHGLTVTASYEFAETLGNNNDMEEANRVLDWLGQNLIKKHGLHHVSSINHYVKVVDLLRAWSRDEDAKLLLFRIAHAWNNDDGTAESHSQLRIPGAASGFAMPADQEMLDYCTLFGKPSDADDVEIQLQLARALMSSRSHPYMDMEPILNTLIAYSEANELLTQTINARCCLAKYFREKHSEHRALRTLDLARPALEDHLRGTDVLAQRLLKAISELAFLFSECHSPDKCEDILELTTDCLERHAMATQYLTERVQLDVVNFPISVGKEYQKRFSWADAAPWFERALASSLRIFGKQHEKTKALERAREEERFLCKSDDLLFSQLEHIFAG